uniref:Uncharacterized protein n=1 Tax=Panagrolaimus sp. ES5 TaxID=591445 RepID=A0AC34GN63_9BILA
MAYLRCPDRLSTVYEDDDTNTTSVAGKNNSSLCGNSRASILEAEMQAYSETNCKCEKFACVMNEYKSLKLKMQAHCNNSVLGNSQISFLEEEMQVYANDICKCDQFQAIVNEYKDLIQNFKNVKVDPNVNQAETVKLKEELEKAKIESEEYKKAAESSKKANDGLKLKLEEAKDQIQNLQKEFQATKLDDENEKKLITTLEIQINALKSNTEDIIRSKNEEIGKLNEKLKDSEKLTQQLQINIKLYQEEKEDFQKLNSLIIDENTEFKKSSEEIISKLRDKLAELDKKFEKSKEENRITLKSLQDAQNEIQSLKEASEQNVEVDADSTSSDDEVDFNAIEPSVLNVTTISIFASPFFQKTKSARCPVVDKYRRISNIHWKFINEFKEIVVVAILPSKQKIRNFTFDYKFGNGYIYKCLNCEVYIETLKKKNKEKQTMGNRGKIFFTEINGEYIVKTGGHRDGCLKIHEIESLE